MDTFAQEIEHLISKNREEISRLRSEGKDLVVQIFERHIEDLEQILAQLKNNGGD